MAKEKDDNAGSVEMIQISKADLQAMFDEFAKQTGIKRNTVGDNDKRRVAAIPFQRFVISDKSGKEVARKASMTEVVDYCTEVASAGVYTVDTVLEIEVK